jgi:hypothetical protein
MDNQNKKDLSQIQLSVLDLAPILAGKTPADSFKNSADLAKHTSNGAISVTGLPSITVWKV